MCFEIALSRMQWQDEAIRTTVRATVFHTGVQKVSRTTDRIYWIGGYSLIAVNTGSILSGHPIDQKWVSVEFLCLILFGVIAKRWETDQSADER